MKRLRDLAGTPLRAMSLLAAVGVLAVGLFLGEMLFSTLFAEFGFHPRENAEAWASIEPKYGGSPACVGCHASEWSLALGAGHEAVACETCHGPQAGHATTGSPAVVVASQELCARCHAEVVGRPGTFPQQDVRTHYDGGTCVSCHEAHSAGADSPPLISHDLTRLPDCAVCHGDNAMRPAPAGHAFQSPQACLSCHGPATGERR